MSNGLIGVLGAGGHRKNWQTGVIIPTHKEGDRRECTSYWGVSLLSFPVKVYVNYLEKGYREIVEPKLEDNHSAVFVMACA